MLPTHDRCRLSARFTPSRLVLATLLPRALVTTAPLLVLVTSTLPMLLLQFGMYYSILVCLTGQMVTA